MTEVAAPSTYVKLKDDEFIEAAGLERSGKSGRKSSVEKLLEQSLNTSESDSPQSSPSKESRVTNGLDTSLQVGVKTKTERPQNLKSDQFIQDAGLSRTGRVGRKSSMERLLEDTLQTGEPESEVFGTPHNDRTIQRSSSVDQKEPATHQYLLQRAATIGSEPKSPDSPKSVGEQRQFSSTSSVSGDEASPKPKSGRKTSIYEQKQIEAPTAVVGNRIASRTTNLFQQYEKDMTSHEIKPLANVNVGEASSDRRRSYERAASIEGDRTKVDIVREQKQKELEEMRLAYQQRLADDEREQEEERIRQRENLQLKSSKALGDVKGRYLAVAQGEEAQVESDGEQVEAQVDKNGETIVKSNSGQREQAVKSADGVGNIRARFGQLSSTSWKKQNQENDTSTVNTQSVNSARNLFKNFEQKQDDGQKSFNRPTSKKVRDPKELMEMRKKVTYGDGDEIPQDGVVKKSVVIDESELAESKRQEALQKYKELESSKNDDNAPTNRPKARLLSDNEAKVELTKRSDSLSGSEPGDVNDITDEVTIDVSGDVSGYEGSVSPCSPTSEMSDDYISDTPKENEKAPSVDDADAFEQNEEVSAE